LIFSPDLVKKIYSIYQKVSPKKYEKWLNAGPFDWGPRPADFIGKTSMKATWIETDSFYYYGEVSSSDPTVIYGKGIKVFKEGV